jgi:polyisoprenoid-binding protein YceI
MLALAMFTALATVGAQARDTVRIDDRAESRVWIEGGSNVADWKCRAASFDARVELDTSVTRDGNLADQIRRVSVKVSARELKCGNRKMEHDLYAALKATDREKPSYILASFNTVGRPTDRGVETQGTLVVAGVEKYVEAEITTVRMPDGTMRAQGAVPLLMTDFGIKPPVGLFGLIRSKNEIVVRFELVIPATGTLR